MGVVIRMCIDARIWVGALKTECSAHLGESSNKICTAISQLVFKNLIFEKGKKKET